MNGGAAMSEHFLGIAGLTVGGAGVWVLVVLALGAALRQWIAGIADRKRAETEGMSAKELADTAAHNNLFEMMQRQMTRMEVEIKALTVRVAELERIERDHLRVIAELRGAQS